jgi:FdhD protein
MAHEVRSLVLERSAVKWRGGISQETTERVAVEEPLEIRLGGRRFTLTMRTPGHDEELAAGFLFAEGFITSANELGEIRRVRGPKGEEPNALDVILNVPAAGLRERLQRNFVISSSCGVCGKTSIEALQQRLSPLPPGPALSADALLALPRKMREVQEVFSATGGLHAAALFAVAPPNEARRESPEPELVVLREDVGRHNAVDKVLGYLLKRQDCSNSSCVMMVSGRLSFEIVQKTAVAGIPILCAVSAPSSLAVELADEAGMTLVGFLRDCGFNIYTCPHRIVL